LKSIKIEEINNKVEENDTKFEDQHQNEEEEKEEDDRRRGSSQRRKIERSSISNCFIEKP
jgi:hypothetical protein